MALHGYAVEHIYNSRAEGSNFIMPRPVADKGNDF